MPVLSAGGEAVDGVARLMTEVVVHQDETMFTAVELQGGKNSGRKNGEGLEEREPNGYNMR